MGTEEPLSDRQLDQVREDRTERAARLVDYLGPTDAVRVAVWLEREADELGRLARLYSGPTAQTIGAESYGVARVSMALGEAIDRVRWTDEPHPADVEANRARALTDGLAPLEPVLPPCCSSAEGCPVCAGDEPLFPDPAGVVLAHVADARAAGALPISEESAQAYQECGRRRVLGQCLHPDGPERCNTCPVVAALAESPARTWLELARARVERSFDEAMGGPPLDFIDRSRRARFLELVRHQLAEAAQVAALTVSPVVDDVVAALTVSPVVDDVAGDGEE